MLKVEYPTYRETILPYQNSVKPIVTWIEAKKHLHDVRLRRQNQLALNIDECHRLRNIHKQLFHGQLDLLSSSSSSSIEKSPSSKSISFDYSLSNNKYSIPRIEYASMIYRQALPTFEIDKSIKFENELPIVKELTQSLTECSHIIPKQSVENHSLKKKNLQRSLSVSPVPSIDKQAHCVYEKWPDYKQISDIVGYRIDPPKIEISQPLNKISRRKTTKSTSFPAASKQIKSIMGLKATTNRQTLSKNKKNSTKINPEPIIVEQPSAPILKIPIKEIKPKLPTLVCPSSPAYSSHIQTRQWLVRNHFSSNALRTLPLL